MSPFSDARMRICMHANSAFTPCCSGHMVQHQKFLLSTASLQRSHSLVQYVCRSWHGSTDNQERKKHSCSDKHCKFSQRYHIIPGHNCRCKNVRKNGVRNMLLYHLQITLITEECVSFSKSSPTPQAGKQWEQHLENCL